MITETGRVLQVEGEWALVACRRQVECARCAAGRGCGGGVLGKLLGDRLHHVRAATGAIRRSLATVAERGRPSSGWTSQATVPVSVRPVTTTYSTATVSMPSLANPESPSVGETTPASSSRVSAAVVMMSGAIRLNANIVKVATTIARLSQPCHVRVSITSTVVLPAGGDGVQRLQSRRRTRCRQPVQGTPRIVGFQPVALVRTSSRRPPLPLRHLGQRILNFSSGMHCDRLFP